MSLAELQKAAEALHPTWVPGVVAVQPQHHSIQGYSAYRGDFDVEFDNEAEQLVADLDFSPSETPQELFLKKTRSACEASLAERLRPLQRFHSAAAHAALLRLLSVHAEAATRCALLREWRSLGLNTLQSVRVSGFKGSFLREKGGGKRAEGETKNKKEGRKKGRGSNCAGTRIRWRLGLIGEA
ncbi:AP2 domain transcription factor apviib-1 ada2-b [Cyclospora cayetanensis]|uniref:AP2 domain transcription factor apviib-1 ada2-b n=1 Tax=Cyclospora cayetanensis TaxID=88456 RepID=A0A1D3D2E7_9EIME|nr:AP2 domain transcription factor apviib-1 ada2-b [Cyclospora cayetanensis]